MKKSAYEKVYICVDDTDDLTKATSTGAIADEIARRVRARFGGDINMGITRHQLLLDERVPYTSHNSSMCFDMMLPAGCEDEIEKIGWDAIHSMMAETSNPGLCVLPVSQSSRGDGSSGTLLEFSSRGDGSCGSLSEFGRQGEGRFSDVMSFGKRAKEELVTVAEAYALAAAFPEIRLKGEGETGQGAIGALAGVGLRMTGNDGRFRGKYDLSKLTKRIEGKEKTGSEHDTEVKHITSAGTLTAEEFIECFMMLYGAEPVIADKSGNAPEPEDLVIPVSEAKAVLRDGRLAFLCDRDESGLWKPYTKDEFNKKRRGGGEGKKHRGMSGSGSGSGNKHKEAAAREHKLAEMEGCAYFETDPDAEERFNEKEQCGCGSCLYRRLTVDGYICMEGHDTEA